MRLRANVVPATVSPREPNWAAAVAAPEPVGFWYRIPYRPNWECYRTLLWVHRRAARTARRWVIPVDSRGDGPWASGEFSGSYETYGYKYMDDMVECRPIGSAWTHFSFTHLWPGDARVTNPRRAEVVTSWYSARPPHEEIRAVTWVCGSYTDDRRLGWTDYTHMAAAVHSTKPLVLDHRIDNRLAAILDSGDLVQVVPYLNYDLTTRLIALELGAWAELMESIETGTAPPVVTNQKSALVALNARIVRAYVDELEW